MPRLLFTLLLSATTLINSYGQNLRSGGKLKAEQANMDIRHYLLSLEVDPAAQTIRGYTDITCVLAQPAGTLLLDLWNGLSVEKVEVNGIPAVFQHQEDLITVRSNEAWPAGRQVIRVYYGGTPGIAERAPWTGGFQWEKDSMGNPWIAMTCQGEGAKIFFPCKDHPSDEPNEGADLVITVPKGLVVAGPGLLQEVKTRKNKATYHWKTKYTINNYCILFNVGKFVPVTRPYTTIDGNTVPMVFYVLEEHKDKAAYHLELLERSCRILEKYFGEYPFAKEKIGICETPHLGMEHQTLNAYGNKFKYAKVGGVDFDWLLHHEFGHEWWANKVSNSDWAHMWIQEGICSFGDALFFRELEGEQGYLKRMQQTARTLNSKIPVVRGEEVDSDSAYEGPIYGKGAFFMHTLRFIMGDDVFFPTLKKLATDPAYTYDNMVHTKDVEKLFSGAAGRPLTPLFDLFLRSAEKLEVNVRQTQENTYQVRLTNISMDLPMEIQTDKGLVRMTVTSEKAVTVNSLTQPVIDPNVFYLKKVILE